MMPGWCSLIFLLTILPKHAILFFWKNYCKSICSTQTSLVVLLHGALKQAPKEKHSEETYILLVDTKCNSMEIHQKDDDLTLSREIS